MIFQGCLSCRNSYVVPGGLYHEVHKSLGMRIRQLSFNTSYQKLHFGGCRRCGKGVKRLRAILYAPRRNASYEVDRFEVAQGMDPTCTQNPWAITAVLLCRHVSEGARPTQGLTCAWQWPNRAPAAGGDHRWVVCCRKKRKTYRGHYLPWRKKKGKKRGKKKKRCRVLVSNSRTSPWYSDGFTPYATAA